ncbi:hypothetical protein J437_LFUL011365 [Ladona fulva]|uniref:ATP-dependent DNA helicase n=1 Tax=Ladona fulva TaxID=123851 RepID=A0A8K0KJL4_LADFU|nr:hypothetical protein J437_LFUL011365 [Ladona fulva]
MSHPSDVHWVTKRIRRKCVARLQWLLPTLGEVYYLRMLLLKFPAYTYEELRTVDGHCHNTFQEAAKAHGLLENDSEYREALEEANIYKTGSGLRQLFSCLVICGAPAGILWDEFKSQLAEDFLDKDGASSDRAYNSALLDIQNRLRSHGRTLEEVGLPSAVADTTETGREVMRWSIKELDLHLKEWLPMLNQNQKEIYDYVCGVIVNQKIENNLLFIDGPSGTGKTLLLNVITGTFRKKEHIVLCTASTGIAALNYKGGVTAHSMFRLPLDSSSPDTYCDIKANSERAELIRRSSLIIWDEASMAQKHSLETLERTLRDICQNELLFGGKLILLAGDFRQIAPVVKGTTKDEEPLLHKSGIYKIVCPECDLLWRLITRFKEHIAHFKYGSLTRTLKMLAWLMKCIMVVTTSCILVVLESSLTFMSPPVVRILRLKVNSNTGNTTNLFFLDPGAFSCGRVPLFYCSVFRAWQDIEVNYIEPEDEEGIFLVGWPPPTATPRSLYVS